MNKINKKLISEDLSSPVKSITYVVYPELSRLHGGIDNKINQILTTLNSHNYKTKKITAPSGFFGLIKIINELSSTSADVVIFRNTYLMPILIPSIILLRIKKCNVILDLPTPLTNVLYEFRMRKNLGFIQKNIRVAIVVIFYPWVLFPFNKILQYATESRYFSLFTRHKTVQVANGINVSSFPRKSVEAHDWKGNSLTIIGVANMSIWHGFDRIIKSIADYVHNTENHLPVYFIVVGEGQAKEKWEKLSQELGISQFISFKGYKRGNNLNELFDQADVAVSGIARFRKKLFEGSALKSREYTARGIPFIAAGSDMDFDPNPDFIFKVEDSEREIDIAEVIQWYTGLTNTKNLNDRIRQYATNKLDFSTKISDFLPLGD